MISTERTRRKRQARQPEPEKPRTEIVARGGIAYRVAKRFLDLAASIPALLILSPFLGVLILVSRVSTKGSGLFRQLRYGKDQKPFWVFKLRTLPEKEGQILGKKVAEQEATSWGRFLRKYKIDELPQFLNVFLGTMSIVGPRPIPVEEYTARSHYERLTARPGITGLWQLSRVRERRFDENPEYDLFYLTNRSIAFDLWLVWRTVLLLLFQKETKIRLAARLWERDTSWRRLIPKRARAINHRRGPLRSRVWFAFGVAAFGVALIPSVVMAAVAGRDLMEARTALQKASQSIRNLDLEGSNQSLDRADQQFAQARGRLLGTISLPGRLVPGFSQNLGVAAALASSGEDLVKAGRQSLEILQYLPFENGRLVPPWSDGRLDVELLARAADPAEEIERLIVRAESRVASSGGRLLIPQVREARTVALTAIRQGRREARAARAATSLIPNMFGAGGSRRWLVAAENLSELRGRGGYLGAFGTIQTTGGQVTLEGFQPATRLPPIAGLPRPERLPPEYSSHYLNLGAIAAWQNLGMSPHFPSVASLVIDQMAAAGLPEASGVISVDPVALSYLMEVSGPLKVEDIAEPLTSENVVDWALNKQYFEFAGENEERKEVLGEVAELLFEKLISADDLDMKALSQAFGRALSERHLAIYSSDAGEQEMIESLGIAGGVDTGPGDYLMVLSQNLGENKMDYYIRNRVEYRGRLTSDGSIESSLDVTIENTAAAEANLPGYIAGPRPHLGLVAGEARSYLSVFVPSDARLNSVMVDRIATDQFDNRTELGRRAISLEVRVKPGESQRITYQYRVPKVVVGDRYLLTVQNQARVHPDMLSVQVSVPPNVMIGLREEFLRGPTLRWEGPVKSKREFAADLRIPVFSRWVARVANFMRRPVVLFEQ